MTSRWPAAARASQLDVPHRGALACADYTRLVQASAPRRQQIQRVVGLRSAGKLSAVRRQTRSLTSIRGAAARYMAPRDRTARPAPAVPPRRRWFRRTGRIQAHLCKARLVGSRTGHPGCLRLRLRLQDFPTLETSPTLPASNIAQISATLTGPSEPSGC